MTKEDGSKYYAYLVVYVDDVLCCDVDPSITMEQILSTFRLKNGYTDPELYLGTGIRPWTFTAGDGAQRSCWAMAQDHMSKKHGGYVTG